MEEDFELISKEKLKKLREENKKLKEELEKKPKTTKTTTANNSKQNAKFIKDVITAIHDESQIERTQIQENLNEIKELNKTTLDNLLTKTNDLDLKLENMVDAVSELVTSLKQIVHKLTDFQDNSIKDEVKKIQELNLDKGLEKTNKTLKDIDLFMKNLRTLLSYIKPSEVRIETKKPTTSIQNQTPQTNIQQQNQNNQTKPLPVQQQTGQSKIQPLQNMNNLNQQQNTNNNNPLPNLNQTTQQQPKIQPLPNMNKKPQNNQNILPSLNQNPK